MKKVFILIAFLATPQLYADPYETAQRFTAGDVISAEVLNDILDRIELSLKPVERDEMIGTWSVIAYFCENGGMDPTAEIYDVAGSDTQGCLAQNETGGLAGFEWDGATTAELGSATRTDTWTITAVSGSDSKFNIATTNYNFFYSAGRWIADQDINDGNTHTCIMLGGQAVLFCALEYPAIDSGGASPHQLANVFNLQRLSPTRIKLFWGISKGSPTYNVLILDKTDIPPVAPTALSASVAGDASAATVTLSWTINGSTATGGIVKRKSAFDGSWSTLGTPSTGSYSDTTININNSYWYRVFATNADGTSVGSNVVKITHSNTPPSFDLPSHIDIYENATAIATVEATDVNGDTLTYSISSQSPGSDATYMSITSGGVLSFDSAPDYENPQDYGTNNTYQIKVTVSDGIDPITQELSVTVMDVSD